MSYIEIVKKFTPLIGKKFSYADASTFWNALNEPFKIQAAAHNACNDYSNMALRDDGCKKENEMIKIMNEYKKTAKLFFDRTITKSPLFSEKDKNDFIKNYKGTKIYNEAVGKYMIKYMKYKAKYLELKANLNLV